jgi:hypothetical protein
VQSLFTTESYLFDMKRPMRTVAIEPNFAKRSSKALVYGGLAGTLVLNEKGWLGHKETVLHSGEGPIWQVRWRSRLIAWANDLVSNTPFSKRPFRIHPDMTFCLSGSENIRYCLTKPDYLHRPPSRQSPC